MRIRNFFVATAVLAVAAFILQAQGFSRAPEPMNTQDAARTSNQFGWDMYHQLKQTPGNLFFSPASIDLALVMTWSGANGETANEMAKVLRLPGTNASLPQSVIGAFGELQQGLSPAEAPYTLRIANRLWGQSGFQFKDSFLEPLDTHFAAGLQELDFQQDSEGSRQTINHWVEEKTEGKIKDLIDSLDRSTNLVLTNAIYFLGTWQRQFQGSDTKDLPFHLAPGETVSVPTMYQSRRFSYGEDDQVQVITLPYRGGDVEMVIVLPKVIEGLAEVEKDIDQDQLDQWTASLAETQVRLYLPKFSLTGEFQLRDVLGAMGMSRAFSTNADFSGMAEASNLAIGQVIHKSFIDVYEKGTEAAAATAVTIRTTSMPGMDPKAVTFKADHPFLFLIRQVDTGTVLFLGRVHNPQS